MTALFEDTARGATVSDDGVYRYDLWRRWDDGPMLGWVMLNPSTADAALDDATIRKITKFSRRDGYAGLVVRNLYAYRTPKPAVLNKAWRAGVDVVGPDNDAWLQRLADDVLGVRLIVGAWGLSGPYSTARSRPAHMRRNAHGQRIRAVKEMLEARGQQRRLVYLADQRTDRPRIRGGHPLYLPDDTPLAEYTL